MSHIPPYTEGDMATTIALGARLHVLIWTRYFDDAWESIPLHEKLAWMLAISNTLAILTLFQLLALA